MNKKNQRHPFRAPTTQPVADVTPSGTLAIDGELPHSASNGVVAPAPLAAHDVLHAAMAHPDTASATAAPDGEHGSTIGSDHAAPSDMDAMHATDAMVAAGENSAAVSPAKGSAKKSGKKSSKTAQQDAVLADAVAPAAPAVKLPKDKFVACNFTLPQSEAAVLSAMKKTHQANGVTVKKSQLLRAALLNLADVDSERLAHLIAQLPVEPVARKKKK